MGLGFIPNFSLLSILCSVVIMRKDGGEKVENVEMDAKSRKAMCLLELIKQYTKLALTARDAGEFLGR